MRTGRSPREIPTRPHVGFVTDSFLDGRGELFEGGAERHLLHLASVAKALGADVTIYQYSLTPGVRDFQGIRVVALSGPRILAPRRLARRALGDGCTHLHFQYVNQVPRIRRPVPVTATNHGVYWDIPYVDQYRNWYPGGRLAALLLPAWRFRERQRSLRALRRCERVMATDSSFLRVVQSDCPRGRCTVEVVQNFTDLADDAPTGSPDDQGHPSLSHMRTIKAEGGVVILVPRNLSLVRGGAWLPEIVEGTIASARVGSLCHFFLTGVSVNVFGLGQRRLELLRRQIASMTDRGRERLHIVGGLPHDLMRAAYELADIVLIPTFAFEATSLAAIEAMGAGRSVVATNVGGLNDLITDHVSGLLVPPNPVELASALVELAENPGLRSTLGAEARSRVRLAWSEDHWRQRAESFGRRAGWAAREGRA